MNINSASARATASASLARTVPRGRGILPDVTPAPLPIAKLPKLADAPHALPYQGSKRALAHFILRLLPDDGPDLVEPFAGSAAVTVGAMHIGAVKRAKIGDINAPLMNLWSRIIESPNLLADQYESLWNEQLADPRSHYVQVREQFNSSGDPGLLLYLLARCVKAAVRYSKTGNFNQSADQRRLGAKPQAMRERILRTSLAMQDVLVETSDYQPLLLDADAKSVVYMDPPYEGVSSSRDHRYMRGVAREAFEQDLMQAVNNGCSFILSYDGATSEKVYGPPLPEALGLTHLHVIAGLSSQATLAGARKTTVESIYLSPSLVERLGGGEALMRSVQADALFPISPPA